MNSRANSVWQPSRLAIHAPYGNEDRIPTDLVYPPSLPLAPTLYEGVAVDPWWLLQERLLSLPSPSMSFPGVPRSPMQVLVFQNNIPRETNLRPRSMGQGTRGGSVLTHDEQRKALEKLKKEIYNPTPKRIIQRLSKFYREGNGRNDHGRKGKLETEEEDDKRCAVCLEDFEPKEVVTITPCDHMFHEDCIVPWVKSHGKCPVCRFIIYDRVRERGVPPTSSDNLASDPLTIDLISILTAMEESRASSTRGATASPFWF